MFSQAQRRAAASTASAAIWLLLCGAPAGARAQEAGTRAGLIADEQRAKAAASEPYRPSRAEVVFQQIEEGRFPLIGTLNGFYPAIGSVYPGGGLGFGGGFRRVIGDRARLDARGLVSLATYKRLEVSLESPGHAQRRLDVGVRVGWLDAPRVSFFGLGADTSLGDHTAFGVEQRYADGDLTWKASNRLHLGLGGGYEQYKEHPGTGPLPSIDERFSAATAPRLGEDPAFAKGAGNVTLLWTDTPAYSRRGGFLRVSYTGYQRLDEEGEFGYTRTEVVQHVPLRRETWVISLRARTDVLVGDDDDAPYFLFPSLGSGTTLRAYQTNRFRDRHTLLFSGEWRWIPNAYALDLAIFADAGTVGARWRDLPKGRFHRDVGIGLRIHTPAATALRIEIARGDEGTRLVVTSSAPF